MDSVGSSLPNWIGGVRAFESLDSRNGAFTEGDWVRPTNGVLQIAFKSASRGCQNLREVKSQTLGDPQRGGGHRQESGTGWASKRVKNECFHFLSPLEVQFRLKSRGKLKCVYFGAFSQLLQNLKQTNTASDPRPVWFRKKSQKRKWKTESLPLPPGWNLIRGGWKGRRLDQKLIWSL